MRVIAGTAGGRRLRSPEGRLVRPTTDRVREAMFNTLGSLGLIEGSSFVDAFAGTGALGIEAWSRGAAPVTFIERDRVVAQVLRANLRELGVDRCDVVHDDAMAWMKRARTRFDVALCDPPHELDRWAELFALVPADVIVAESGEPLVAPPGWDVLRQRRYGRSHVLVAQRVGYGDASGPGGDC